MSNRRSRKSTRSRIWRTSSGTASAKAANRPLAALRKSRKRLFFTAMAYDGSMADFLKDHSNEIMIICLVAMVMTTLIVIIPKLLRWHQRMQELRHAERLKGIELGLSMPPPDDRFKAAGRTAIVVPSVAVIVA